jgi:hypothetical protein
LPAFSLSTGDPLVVPSVVVDGAHPAGATEILTRNDGSGTLTGEVPDGSGVELGGALSIVGIKSRATRGVLTLTLEDPLVAPVADGATVIGVEQSFTAPDTLGVLDTNFYVQKRPEAKATAIVGFEFQRNSVERVPTGDWSCVRGRDSGQVIDVNLTEGLVSVWIGQRLLQRG